MLIQQLGRNAVQLRPRQAAEQPPAQLQGLIQRPVFRPPLLDKLLFKPLPKGNIHFIHLRKLLFADDRGQGASVLHAGIAGE